MRKTYRRSPDSDAYWNLRWQETGLDQSLFYNTDVYPLRYVRETYRADDQVLDVGFGAGRILRHLSQTKNFGDTTRLFGIEASSAAINLVSPLARINSTISFSQADARAMPFRDNTFDLVLSFGVLHSIEHNLDLHVKEIERVLKPDGRFVMSVRANTFETRLNEMYFWWKQRSSNSTLEEKFHKWLFSYDEVLELFKGRSLRIEAIRYERNFPFLFRFRFMRRADLRNASPEKLRSTGYLLNDVGNIIERLTFGVLPKYFASLIVISGVKETVLS